MIRDAVVMVGGEFDEEEQLCFKEGISQLRNPLFIAADKGIEYLKKMDINPDIWVGDFDSVDEKKTESMIGEVQKNGGKVKRLNPIKDDTDTEVAINIALSECEGDIFIYGGCGGRMDHFISNVHILKIALEKKRRAFLISKKEKIFMTNDMAVIEKEKQFGNFISIFPFSEEAKGVSLEGFKYPLCDAVLSYGSSLGQSNEIIDERAVIKVKKGTLLVIESRG